MRRTSKVCHKCWIVFKGNERFCSEDGAELRPVILNKTFVDNISKPGKYRDSELRGFGIRVTQSKKSYFVENNVKGRKTPIFSTIGEHGKFTPQEARNEARERLMKMKLGVDPRIKPQSEIENDIQKARRILTLQKVFDDYRNETDLKPETKKIVTYLFNKHLQDWLNKPISSITPDMVVSRHDAISSKYKATANNTMRYLRAVFGFAIAKSRPDYRIDGENIVKENPVVQLSREKKWHVIDRRKSVIKEHQLKDWFSSVLCHKNKTVSDYLIFLLLTGLRKNEAASLVWKNVDLKSQTILVTDTKNRDDLLLPLSDYAYRMLLRRWEERGENLFVFPANTASGHLRNIRYHIDSIREDSKVAFTAHDLRRTFATTAYRLCTQYEVKKLLNHKMSTDVTDGYIVASAELLREPMQKITDALLEKGHVRKDTIVVTWSDVHEVRNKKSI